MEFVVFSSGSKGNSSLLRTKELNILIDCGISKKDLVFNLEKSNLKLNDIDYLFVTHEHQDHIKSFNSMLKIDNLKICISKGTLDYIYRFYYNKGMQKECDLIDLKLKNYEIIPFEKIDNSLFYKPIFINDLRIDIIPLFHDANEPTGFLFEENNKKLCYITDTGYVHSDCYEMIRNSDCYLLESNHDPEVLMASDRPYYLKQRIASEHGHLSNEDSMYVLTRIIGENTKLILHAHVSEECNLSQIINLTRKRIFESYGFDENDYKCVILNTQRSEDFDI